MKGSFFCKLIILLLSLEQLMAVDEAPLKSFIEKHVGPIYQDLVIGKKIYPIGTDLCEPRYELIRPILDLYDKPFSVLDLGAAQGYFSFRIANDFPHSYCVMIEANDTSYYSRHGDMLYDLCLLNSHLNNVVYLQRRINLSDLLFLHQKEHFDVVIALLVVHLMDDSLKEQIKIIETLLDLGDNLILEVADDVGVIHTAYVEFLRQTIDGIYLGEVKRHKDVHSHSKGKFFWFKRKAPTAQESRGKGIQEETFTHLNGVFPIL